MNDTTATRDQAPETQAAADDSAICPIAFILGDSDRRFWGLGTIERLRNSLARVGVTDHRLVETSDGIDMSDLPDDGKVMLLRGDHIYEERLLKALARHRDIMLILPGADDRPRAAGAVVPAAQARWAAECVAPSAEIDAHALPPGMRAMDPAQAASSFDNQLRKRAAPYVFDTLRHRQEEIEKRMFQGAYKGVTDLVTKWLWPWPARHVTRWLAPTPVTPNMVTALSLVFVFVAMYFFGQGWFLWGVAAAWFMTFLDTVDGKLARVTLTSSKWGNVFDHGIDLIHPPFWWAAWYYGCLAVGTGVSGDLLFADVRVRAHRALALAAVVPPQRAVAGLAQGLAQRRLEAVHVAGQRVEADEGQAVVGAGRGVAVGDPVVRTEVDGGGGAHERVCLRRVAACPWRQPELV